MSEKNQIGKETISVTVAKIIAQALTMIAAMLMSRFLSLEEYGTYSQVILVINMVTSLLMLGLPNSMNYFMGRAENIIQRRQFLSIFYTLNTVLGLAVGIVLLLGSSLMVSYFKNHTISTLWFFLLLYPFGKIITSSAENLYVVCHKTTSLLFFRVAFSFALIVAIIISYIMRLGFTIYMVILLVITLVFTLIVFVDANRFGEGIGISLSPGFIKQILVFSIPLGLATAVGTINIELGKFMVGRFVDTSTLAIYANASKEMPIAIIANAFTAVLLPKFAQYLKHEDYKKVVELWGSSTKIAFLVVCYLSIGMFVFASDCLRILYSEKYVSGENVFRVYCIVLLMRATYFGSVLTAAGKSKQIFYSALAALGLNCVLNYLLYIPFGLVGSAMSTLISQVIINGFQLIYSAKLLDVKLSKLFPWKDLFIIMTVNIFIGIVFYGLKIIIPLGQVLGTVFESFLLALIWGALDVAIFRRMAIREWQLFNEVKT